MAASRPAAIASATTSHGSLPTNAFPENRAGHDRNGRGNRRARRQDFAGQALLPLLGNTLCIPIRPRRARPLGVENRLHWVMDVVFHDDLMRLRSQNGPANMAAIRHVSINIIKQINDKASIKTRRKTLGWDDDYLFNAIVQPNS